MSYYLDDGFPTTISIAAGTLTVVEKSITPPGVQGGGEINTTSMRNTAWRTKAPKSLKEASPIKLTVKYGTGVYNQIYDQINVNQALTITFPDNHTLVVWGWVDSFVPNEHTEGEEPTAEMEIIISNVNASGVETPPVYT